MTEYVSLEFSFHAIKQPKLPIVPSEVSEDESRDVNTRYSGLHDHGDLPPLRNSGALVDVLSHLHAAKYASDQYLTSCMDKERVAKQGKDGLRADGDDRGEITAAGDTQEGTNGVLEKDVDVDQETPTAAAAKRLRA